MSLPFLISIPHGGTVVPAELRKRVRLSDDEILADGDPFTDIIYDVKDEVAVQLTFEIARAIIDVNRAPDDLPPANPDGVLKTLSIFGNRIYHPGMEPHDQEISRLLAEYHQPYHDAIGAALSASDVVLALDCHSMEAVGPPIAADAGERRPLFCLGNNGGMACSMETTRLFAHCLAEVFAVSLDAVTINRPFAGGYITRRYGGVPVPWIQVEMSRGLYLGERNLRVPETADANPEKLRELNGCFRRAIRLLAGRL
ncbi:MAG: N-formylglutamate deformylase [Desulfobulbaceae bacterium]